MSTETRWKPGQSGNPSGLGKDSTDLKKKLKSLTPKAIQVLEAVLDADNIADKDKISVARFVIERTIPAETTPEPTLDPVDDPVSRLATILRRKEEPATKDLEDFQAVAAASQEEI